MSEATGRRIQDVRLALSDFGSLAAVIELEACNKNVRETWINKIRKIKGRGDQFGVGTEGDLAENRKEVLLKR